MFICYARVEGFYARPHGGTHPVVVHHDGRVLDACAEARRAKVAPGIALSEAKAILPRARWVAYEPEPYREASEAWLDVCAELSDRIEPEMPHAAYLDLSAHARRADLVVGLELALRERLGWRVTCALAPGKWLARLAVDLEVARVDDAATFLDRLPVAMLAPVSPEHRRRLQSLGFRTIGQVARAPLGVLLDQFGDEGIVVHEAARGRGLEPVRADYPERAAFARHAFESPADSRPALDAGLASLAGQLAEVLTKGDLQGQELRAHLEDEDGRITSVSRNPARPIQTSAQALFALRLVVGEPERPPLAIRACMPRLQPRGASQLCLRTVESPRQRRQSAEIALRAVRAAFGDDAVQPASELSEPRRIKVLRAWREATGWF